MISPAPTPQPETNKDRLPLWVILLLGVFLMLRLVDLSHQGSVKKNGRLSQNLAGQVSEKTMQSNISANWSAKSAYLSTYTQLGGSVVPSPSTLREALKSAEELQTDTNNSPSAARRVLLLRALLKLPPLAAGGNGLSPAQAFTPSALGPLSPEDRSLYTREGHLWTEVFRGPHLTPAQTEAYAAELRATPNIRWWLSPALSVLYRSQGNPHEADKQAARARSQALLTSAPMGLLGLLWFALGSGGVVLLITILMTSRQSLNGELAQSSLWPKLRETVPLAERRLRAGDLMGVFVVYLLMPDIFGWLLGGFGVPHRFYFPGLLAPWRHSLAGLSSSGHTAAVIVLEFIAYLIGAAVPIALLIVIARRRRASIGEELGWNLHRFGKNLLFGVGGYAIALPLLMAASFAAKTIHAPAPSNPAIPLLAGASSVWVQIMLVSLATIAAPLTEELLFRGVFYNAAKLKVGVWPAIVLTGLVFGFAHPVGIAQMVPLAVLGGVFAWMAETRQSLVPSMLGHFLQNSMATAMLLLALGG